jgi:hypothetical protein
MVRAYAIIIVVLTLLVLYQTFSPREIIVCSNGDIVKDIMDCQITPNPAINQRQAETAVSNYGNAQANAKGDQFTRVNVYREGPDYFAQAVFTNRQSGNVQDVMFKINGRTGVVECFEGCEYFQRTTQSEDI